MNPSDDKPAKQESPKSAGDSQQRRFSPVRDPNLPHQPVLSETTGRVTISCNCRAKKHLLRQGGEVMSYEPMGMTTDRYDTQALYNDPANHRKPFGAEDEIHYKDVEPWHGG